MQAELEGVTRPVVRYRRGVIWCPFCDRSTQDEGIDVWCEGCNAQFMDEANESVAVAPVRKGRGRARRVASTSLEEVEEVDEEVDLESSDAVL